MMCFLFPVGGKVEFSFLCAHWCLYSTVWLCPLPCCIPLLPGLLVDGQQWGRRSLSDISPGLQLWCRRACVSLGPLDVFTLSEVVLGTWIAPLVSGGLECFLKRIPSWWGENNLKLFKLVVWPCTLGDRAEDMVLVALRFSSCPLEGKAINLTCAWLRCGRKAVSVIADWNYPAGCPVLEVIEALCWETAILMWRFCTWVISFVPSRFWKYKREGELYIVVCVNSTSDCLNPCAKCPLWMLQGGRGKAAVSAVVIIDPLKRAALILHVTASWKFR